MKDTLKLAFEALKSSNKLINGTGTKFGLAGAMDGYYSGCFDVEGNNKLLNDAISAIKEALAQPEQDSGKTAPPEKWGEVSREELIKRELEMVKRIAKAELTLDGLTPTEFALRELYEFQEATGCDTAAEFKAQPEQEPVAWIHNHIKGNVIAHRPVTLDRHPDHWTALYPEPKPCPTCEALARTVMLDQTSHDTTPPQRIWVGLTDEEISEAVRGSHNTGSFVRVIEAKLKEKNDA